MSNIGFVLYHLGPSQATNETIKVANGLNDSVIFFEQLIAPSRKIDCATMSTTELPLFSGILITSNIENTLLAHNIVNRKKVKTIFYVWDLEWLRPGHNNYLYNIQAYNIADILVVRNEDHIGPLYNYCNRKPIVNTLSGVIQC